MTPRCARCGVTKYTGSCKCQPVVAPTMASNYAKLFGANDKLFGPTMASKMETNESFLISSMRFLFSKIFIIIIFSFNKN